jgi:hypothetical protein
MDKILFEVLTLIWKKHDTEPIPDQPGLYQIYGTSPLYGIETLLYIGQAKNLEKRLSGHFKSEESFIGRQPNKSIRYATLSPDLLTFAEETLIIMHKPSFNSARLIQVSSLVRTRPIYIQNHGDRGMLSIENTNYYFLNPDMKKYIDLPLPSIDVE